MWRKILLAFSGGVVSTPACQQAELRDVVGRLADIESHLRQLAASPDAFLIIEAGPNDAFVQIKYSRDGFELDHPLATPAQRARESQFRAFCAQHQVRLQESRGTDGTVFLDCYLPPDPVTAAEHVAGALTSLLGVTSATELRFAHSD
jgi:hypothetical protein